MDEELINGYINNLAAEVQKLTMENVLLKTRLGIFEGKQREAEATANGGDFQTPPPQATQEPEAPKVTKPAPPVSKGKPNKRDKSGNFIQE